MAIIHSLEKNQTEDIIKEIYQEFEGQGKKVPEWMKIMAHCPKILKEFKELFNVIMSNEKIERCLKWKIAYMVSETLRCPFCVDVTSKMLETMGAKAESLKNLKKIENLPEKEKNLFKLVKEITLKANVCTPGLLEKFRENYSEAEIVEIVSIIGLFNYINRFNNSLCILPE